ncbi:cytochrome P450 [Paeniglutamicibacter sp. ABSL32-1]|uniref:cytochrome P450 n=1 Tax=Paeniglutamicibacter quisquiliarum TaxID=2849498 RepID=UPI001C2D7C8F|nr:cytochrome P450 [Paeniglutamicibacter quisquiliarum]MBV1778863.1 cytochrome P450 [Paeniglutamicibacter quisquiliarum]
MDSTLAAATAPLFTEDPYSLAHLAEPYGLFERMRDAGPVVRLEEHDVLAVTRFDECKEVLEDYRTFISGAGAGPRNLHREPSWRAQGIMESDPPIHTQMRHAIAGVISPRGVRSLRAGFEQYATELVDELLDRGEFDLVKDMSEVFPLRAFGDAVGIPREGRAENLLALGAANFSTFGPDTPLAREHFSAGAGTNDWAMANTARERLSPGSLGAQIWDYADRGEITADQAPLLVRAMLSAGLDTTIFSLGATLLALVRHPGQYAKVHENPKLVKFAIDEAFRYESPFQSFYRTTSQPAEIGGMAIPAETKVAVFVGAANRDERRWGPTANEYDITRAAGGHLAFGMGIHQCVGQPLSRLEMDVLITELARRVKSIELTAEPEQFMHTTLRGWKSIPVRVAAA